MNDATSDRTFSLAGEMHALVSFALALAECHPDKELLKHDMLIRLTHTGTRC